ncbi:hypothetical protein G5B37_13160 [Rasiella rasia]|uniref:Uncharacterized protein n=1 Tax=Rasiella rasia TaxID=2744027 RepID=A0A6G6GPG8_9FLAO|nr:hypothetical protein [Rasiella rasia]QIE60476.1 hypothetical protein G5B37_13160 [Rasiella rasia]
MTRTLLLIMCISTLFSCNDTAKNNDRLEFIPDHDANPVLSTAEIIAHKNGLLYWKDVSEISFTFNVDRGEKHFERSWIWSPKSHDVTLKTATDTISYNRKEMDSTSMKTDGGFINDSYWLLAPYKLVWDEGTNISETEKALAPISQDTLNKLTITYGDEGGYTPGDAYDFFYDDNFMVQEWIFREGNSNEPSMITTFEDYKDFNGLKLATMHQDSTGGFKLYFTNISVKK